MVTAQEHHNRAQAWQRVFDRLVRETGQTPTARLELDADGAAQLSELMAFATHKANEDIGRVQPVPAQYGFGEDDDVYHHDRNDGHQ